MSQTAPKKDNVPSDDQAPASAKRAPAAAAPKAPTPKAKSPKLEAQDMRHERDRFVAFSFCASDVLIELDERHRIVFAAGAVLAFLGVSPEDLVGQPLLLLVAAQSRPAASELLIAIGEGRRLEPMMLHMVTAGGSTMPLLTLGYSLPLPDFEGHMFLAFRHQKMKEGVRKPKGQLLDTDDFAALVAERASVGADPGDALTLIEVASMAAPSALPDPAGQHALNAAVASCLSAEAAGSIIGEIDKGRYGLLHTTALDLAALGKRLGNAASSADPEGAEITVISASTGLVCKGSSAEDTALAAACIIQDFRRAATASFGLDDQGRDLPELLSNTARRVALVKKLIEDGAFEIHYQPVVKLKTRATEHFEALTRLTGKNTQMSTFEFICFAERIGIIASFDLAVCRRVVKRVNEQIEKREPWPIAVNVSGRSIEDPVFRRALLRLLGDNPQTRPYILFELTESMALRDVSATNEFIQKLRVAGHKVCLDDFGVGASAFEYLRAIEIDLVKIDGSYVQSALQNRKSGHFLRAIVSLCRDLGVATVAEMVEEEAHVRFLIDSGLDYGQGYLFGNPSAELEPTSAISRPSFIQLARDGSVIDDE
ncbi:MAG: EAL domain-containing protein [Alphaproteobacteria bacterium]|nr:EAL domain-containing protein [Alphaproteobacteria bacterium]